MPPLSVGINMHALVVHYCVTDRYSPGVGHPPRAAKPYKDFFESSTRPLASIDVETVIMGPCRRPCKQFSKNFRRRDIGERVLAEEPGFPQRDEIDPGDDHCIGGYSLNSRFLTGEKLDPFHSIRHRQERPFLKIAF